MPGTVKPSGKAKKLKENKKCVIPPRVADGALNRFTLGRNENEADRISDFVEWQCAKDNERVTYLEKVMAEHVFTTRYACWNVRTNRERYRVIANPTNLYSQKLFPGLDYTLSFHIGLTARVQAKRTGTDDDRLADRLAGAFRRREQAAEALDRSEESEEIQAVGMRCRECLVKCLVTLTRSIANPAMVPKGREAPKAGDFIHWSELIADSIASGSSDQEIRGYLKSIARSVWQLVSWLTHALNAVVYDGKAALHATYEVLNLFGAALIRSERKTTDRCPSCGSLRVGTIYKPDADTDDALCESCGWNTDTELTVSSIHAVQTER